MQLLKIRPEALSIKGNSGHRSSLIFQYKNEIFQTDDLFLGSVFSIFVSIYKYFIKIRPKFEIRLKSGQWQSPQIWQFCISA